MTDTSAMSDWDRLSDEDTGYFDLTEMSEMEMDDDDDDDDYQDLIMEDEEESDNAHAFGQRTRVPHLVIPAINLKQEDTREEAALYSKVRIRFP